MIIGENAVSFIFLTSSKQFSFKHSISVDLSASFFLLESVDSASTKSTTPRSGTTSSKSTATQKPAVGGATGGRGFFNDPTIQACLTKEGVSLTPGVRPDRTDPKVAAAFAKCLPGFGSGGGSGGGFGGDRPSGAPTPAPSN